MPSPADFQEGAYLLGNDVFTARRYLKIRGRICYSETACEARSAIGQKRTVKREIDYEFSLAIDQLLGQCQRHQRTNYRETGDEEDTVVDAASHVLDHTHHIGADEAAQAANTVDRRDAGGHPDTRQHYTGDAE